MWSSKVSPYPVNYDLHSWRVYYCIVEFTSLYIAGILGTENLPEPLNLTEGVRSFPWHISTKYYDADIQVCALDRKTIASQAFADTVNAVVICFDTNAVSC